MIQTNASWDAKNALLAKMPIYAFAIEGQTFVYTTADLAAQGITGTLPSYHAWLKIPQGPSQSIDVVNGTSSIGEMTCEVIDPDGSVLAIAGGTPPVEGSTATLSVGYPGLAWGEFVTLHTYVVYKVNPTAGYASYVFVCRDRQMLAKKTIYTHPENGALIGEDNPWYLAGTPAEIFQAVALFGLGLDAADVDRAGLAALDAPGEGNFAPWRPFLFALTESFEAKNFLETEVLKPSGMYPVVNNLGQLSVRASRPPSAGATPVFTFTADNMTILPELDRMPVINEAVWEYDYDGSAYQQTLTVLEGSSIAAFGRGNQWKVSSQGLRTECGAAAYAQWVTDRMFRRFAGTPGGLRGGAPVISIQAFFLTLPVWVGDYVAVTHAKMPDMTAGTLGVTARVYEVIDRQPDYANGCMKYRLLDTGLTGAPAACTFGAGSANPLVVGTGKWY